PAEECDPLAAVFADDDALLAIIHAQREVLAAALDELHPQKAGAEGGPILERFCANTDIAEPLNVHGRPPSDSINSRVWASLALLAIRRVDPVRPFACSCGPEPRWRRRLPIALHHFAAARVALACVATR